MTMIKVALPTATKIGEKEVTALEFREPIGADIEQIIGNDSIGESITSLAASLCTTVPLEVEDVRALSADNYLAISGVLIDFLG